MEQKKNKNTHLSVYPNPKHEYLEVNNTEFIGTFLGIAGFDFNIGYTNLEINLIYTNDELRTTKLS